MKPIFRFLSIAGIVAALVACDSSEKEATDGQAGSASGKSAGPLKVLTTFYPTQYFTQRIGGDLVDVSCPVPMDEDPIFWMPDAAAIQQYQAADLIVLNGAGFAKWIEKVSLPQSRILDTALPLEPEFIKFKDAVEHSHGKGGSHAHEGIDGHTWVDPVNAKVQAGEIRNALILRLPDAHETLEANYVALAADLDQLDKQFKEIAASSMPKLLGSHPAYNYIARRYGWQIENLDLDPAVQPDAGTLEEIREKLKSYPAVCLLWESEPVDGMTELLEAEVGLKSITFSPCELLDSEGSDYLKVMRENVERLRSICE